MKTFLLTNSLTRSSLIALVSIVGCGGGGGGGDQQSAARIAGVYRGTLYEVQNTCRSILNVSDVVSVLWTVNQDGKRVVLSASTGNTYKGVTTGEDSFRVSKTVPGDSNCLATTTVSMDMVRADSAEVDLQVSEACSSIECVVGYAGTVSRD